MPTLRLIQRKTDKIMSVTLGSRKGGDPGIPELNLVLSRKHIREFKLDAGTTMTIGRHRDNNIVIEEPTVSKRHAKIESSQDGYLLIDLKSKNGTLVNKVSVTSRWLEHGDVLKIGKHHLLFAFDKDELAAKDGRENVANAGVTKPDTEQEPASTVTTRSKMVTHESEGDVASVLWLKPGPKYRVDITHDLIKVGRDPSCEIVLDGLMVGKIAFTIGRRRAGYYLSFVGGMSVPRVNGRAVRRSMKLEPFDIIEIRSARLQFLMGNQNKLELSPPAHALEQVLER